MDNKSKEINEKTLDFLLDGKYDECKKYRKNLGLSLFSFSSLTGVENALSICTEKMNDISKKDKEKILFAISYLAENIKHSQDFNSYFSSPQKIFDDIAVETNSDTGRLAFSKLANARQATDNNGYPMELEAIIKHYVHSGTDVTKKVICDVIEDSLVHCPKDKCEEKIWSIFNLLHSGFDSVLYENSLPIRDNIDYSDILKIEIKRMITLSASTIDIIQKTIGDSEIHQGLAYFKHSVIDVLPDAIIDKECKNFKSAIIAMEKNIKEKYNSEKFEAMYEI